MRRLPNDENMENINETPHPEDNDDSLDAEGSEPDVVDASHDADESTEQHTSDLDPDELLAQAAALSDPIVEEPELSEPAFGPTAYGQPRFEDAGSVTAPPPPVYAETRLTRDPFATFGGVLSGIAHRYGWDVAITRLAFVIITLMSGGTAFVAYGLAWLVIPRAQFWPPAQRHTAQVSGRDLGVGLLALAALIVLGIGSGQFAGVLVPLALIGGGVWLLSQNPRTEDAPVPSFAGAGGGSVGGPTPQFNQAPLPPFNPQPAPKRSRLGRGALVAGVLAIVALPVLVIGGAIGAAIAFGEGDWEFDANETYGYDYTSVDGIPSSISEEEGELIVDLSEVDFSGIDSTEDRVELDVDLSFGRLEVVLPADVRVDIEADADFAGNVELFDERDSGLSPDRSFSDENPQLVLDLEVDAGEIVVRRAAG